MATSSEAIWSPPDDSDVGYATKIGGSIVDQFVLGHEPTDVLRELVQNEFDADGEVMAVTFGLDQLSISGSGRPITKKGWDRLDVVIGTGRVAGDVGGAEIEPKENGIGSKNFGLRSLFLFGDRIYVRSNGRRAVQNLIRLATKIEPDTGSKGQRGVSIHVPYRTEAFGKLQPFTAERETETFDKMAGGLLATMVKLALPGRKRGIRALTLRSDRQGRTLSWRQDVEREACKVTGVSALRRIGRLTDRSDEDVKPATRRFEEIEFTRVVPVPAKFAGQALGPYYEASAGSVRIGISLPIRLKRPDLSVAGRFFYPLQTPSSATGSAVGVSAPFDLVADRSALLDCEWNTWLMGQAAELTVTLLTDDWVARFGSDAFLAIRTMTEAKPAAFAAALKKHLQEAACWPTSGKDLAKATDLVLPEEGAFTGLLSSSHFLRPDLAGVPELRELVSSCGAKPFTRNSLIRLRCAADDPSGLATKVSKEDADLHFTDYSGALADPSRQRIMGQAIASVGRRLSNENRRDLKSTNSTLAADGSLQAAETLVVVEDEIWDVCQAPLATRLHRSLNGEKALTDLCTPFDLDIWVRAAAERARVGAIEDDERQKLYKHLLSEDVVLSRSIVSALKPSPVLRDHRGGWAAPNDMVLLPVAQAQLFSRTIHAPAPAVTKRPKLLAALRLREKLTGDDLVAFAAHLISEPEKAGPFEALLKNNPQLLTAGTVKRLRSIPFLATRAGELAAPLDLFLDNEVNRICAANDNRIVAGRNHVLYARLGCQERPSVAVMLKALEELNGEGQAPADVATFYAALVQALRAEKIAITDLSHRPILWCRGAYSAPRDVLVGTRVPAWFQKATPHLRGPSSIADSFEALGAATSPQDHHWIKLFQWAADQRGGTSAAGAEVRQILRDAYQRRGFSGLPEALPEDVHCLLGQDARLFSRADVRSGAFVEDDFPALATALSQAGASTGFAAITEESRNFFGSLSLQRLTSISGTPKLAVGLESKPPPWFKAGHSDRILGLLKREDFRTAIDLLVYGYRREHGSLRVLLQREVMDRLRSIEHVRFVTGIDRRYSVGGKTVAITTEAAAVDGDIALKPTRTKFEFEQNLTYALAELLGATQVSDARRLSVALLPLLMCESSADMFAYLERQGLKPPTWIESAMPALDPDAEAEPGPSLQQAVIQTLLTEMFDHAAAAGPDQAPQFPPATNPPVETSAPPPAPRSQFELPSLDKVTARVESPTDHALAARPPSPSGGGWYTSGSSSWRPPDAYDVDRDQKVGARGEEIVYLAELERVRALGHERPEDHVVWVSKTQPGADHDIRSIGKDGKPLWLEVKSTMGIDGRFDWSQREFEKALRERDRYVLWRVYEAHTTHPVAKAFANPAALLARSKLRVELSGMVGFVEPK
jgi:hypothetical protein